MKKMIWFIAGVLIGTMIAIVGAGDLPDPAMTPGAANPAVTQANIAQTICVPGWTKTIRPSASYTNKIKLKQIRGTGPYASALGATAFEEDHRLPLEVGGNPIEEKNLWPEPWSSAFDAHKKDRLENLIHKKVCSGELSLKEGQGVFLGDFIASYKKYVK